MRCQVTLPTSSQKLLGIQWLRALAAIAVVAFHAADRWRCHFEIGQAGVDIFFVISGFIIWSVARGPVSLSKFVRDRVTRVVPLYWFATAVLCVGAALGLFPNLRPNLVHVILSLFFIANHDEAGKLLPTLGQGWTLDYEMVFYLVVSAIILAPVYIRLYLLLSVFTLIPLMGVFLNSQNEIVRFYTHPMIIEFAFGVIIAHYFARQALDRRIGLLLVAAGALAFVAFGVNLVHGAHGLTFGLAAALLVGGVVALETSGVSFAVRPLVFLGDASYSIYLFHAFAISVALRFMPSGWGIGGALAGTAFGALVGCIAYLMVERPLMVRLRRPRPAAAAVGAA